MVLSWTPLFHALFEFSFLKPTFSQSNPVAHIIPPFIFIDPNFTPFKYYSC